MRDLLGRWLCCPFGFHGEAVAVLVVSGAGTGTIHACKRCARRLA